MNDKPIRKAVFGGFNRSDVAEYIEQFATRASNYQAEKEALSAQCDELRKALSDTEGERDRLGSALRDEQDRANRLAVELDEARKAANGETERTNDAVQQLRAEVGELRARLASAEKKAEMYDAARVRIADIELDAGRRAEQTEREAAAKAEGIIRRCTEYLACVKEEFVSAGRSIQADFPMLIGELGILSERLSTLGAFFNDKADGFTSYITGDDGGSSNGTCVRMPDDIQEFICQKQGCAVGPCDDGADAQ